MLERGFWAVRSQDAVAILFSDNTVSGQLGKVQAHGESMGRSISTDASGVQTHEMILEVDYNIHVWRGVGFQPDFHHVVRPNAQANISDAAVVGCRAHVWF